MFGYRSRDWGSLVVVLTRELRSHSRNALVWGLTLFGAVLAGISAHLGAQELNDRLTTHAELVRQLERDVKLSGRQLTGWRLDPALRAIRAPQPMSAVIAGQDVSLPDFWDFGPAGVRTGRQYTLSTSAHGRVDLDFVLRIILGLLALILVLESIASERASGILLALTSQAVRPEVIVAGKIAAGAGVLAVTVSVVAGATLLGVWLRSPEVVTRDFMSATGLLGLAGCLYLFTYFALGSIISVRAASYRVALVATAILWLFGGVVAQPLAQLLAANLAPLPPVSLVDAESDRVARALVERAEIEIGAAYLAAVPPGVHWSEASRDAAWTAAVLAEVEPIWNRHAAALAAELGGLADRVRASAERQRWIRWWLGLISPGAQFSDAAANLAGTGDAQARRWESSAARHQARLEQLLFHNRPRVTGIVETGTGGDGGGEDHRWEVGLSRRPFPNVDALPEFPRPPSLTLRDRLVDALPALALLGLYAAVLGTGAVLGFGRLTF